MFEQTSGRLWKRLTRDERLAAARLFFAQPPQEAFGSALAVLVKARHLRPQVARSLPPEEQARALSSVLDVGETLAGSLLVALHLGERRALLAAFLDATGLPHDNGLLAEDASGDPVPEAVARRGVDAVRAAFPEDQVRTYLNTLWLQDHDRWAALEQAVASEAST
jgi:hypothetical protein